MTVELGLVMNVTRTCGYSMPVVKPVTNFHSRNFSSGSTDTGFSGSMEKRQRDRMGVGRVDAATVIDEILEGVGDIGIGQEDGADCKQIFSFLRIHAITSLFPKIFFSFWSSVVRWERWHRYIQQEYFQDKRLRTGSYRWTKMNN